MFWPAGPWWESLVRVAILYFALLVMVRMAGKRTIGQYTTFDLLVVLLLSEAVSPALSGDDDSVGGALLRAATLIGLNLIVANVVARSRRLERIVEGRPVILGRDGGLYDDVMVREHVGREDIDKALREAECTLEDLEMAVLESDGKISVRKRDGAGDG